MKIILTGATGMVGEGVLLTCLEHPKVTQVLSVSRRPYEKHHPKLKQLVIHDFMDLSAVTGELVGYDACFYCAGISSRGMTEEQYTKVTYDTPLHFAETLAKLNPNMVLCHVSGASTDGTEKSRMMWARVKGRAENALARLPFKAVYNFRPGAMKPVPGQVNVKGAMKVVSALYPALHLLFPKSASTLKEVADAMLRCVERGYDKTVLEVVDIKDAART